MADHTPLDIDALEAALAAAAAKPWRVSDGGIDAIVLLRNTALALIAKLRAAEAENTRLRDVCSQQFATYKAAQEGVINGAEATIAAAREAHATALAHALRPLDEPMPFAVQFEPGHAILVEKCDAKKINAVLAARLAAAKETTT